MTKQQRLDGYKYALKHLSNAYTDKKHIYLCNLLHDYCKVVCHFNFTMRRVQTEFVELRECKPDGIYFSWEAWWPLNDLGILIRTIVLEWCIDSLTSK